MKSFTTPDFWETYAALSPQVKQQAKKAYRLWSQNNFLFILLCTLRKLIIIYGQLELVVIIEL